MARPELSAIHGIVVVVTSGVGRYCSPRFADRVKWVVLADAGFVGKNGIGISVAAGGGWSSGGPGWLELPDPECIPEMLLRGWAEARHGA